jgi:hypothetical protein
MEWKLIDTAPFDRDLELALIDGTGTHVVAFRVAALRILAGVMSKPTNEFSTYVQRTGETTRPEVCSTKSMFQTHNRIYHTSRYDERYCA